MVKYISADGDFLVFVFSLLKNPMHQRLSDYMRLCRFLARRCKLSVIRD